MRTALPVVLAASLLHGFCPAAAGANAAVRPVFPSGPPSRTAAGESMAPSLSADGRSVAFLSSADNLTPGDINGGTLDVFLHRLDSGETLLVTVNTNGTSGNGPAEAVAVSADGAQVVFVSRASDLVPGDTNGVADVFVRDMALGTTRCVSRGPGGGVANRESGDPAISPDGRFVAFESWASNLVDGDTNKLWDVFLLDRVNGVLERLSVPAPDWEFAAKGAGPSRHPVISDDGQTRLFAGSGPSAPPLNLAPPLNRGGSRHTNGLILVRPAGSPPRMVDIFAGAGAGAGATAIGGNVLPISYAVSADGRYAATLAWSARTNPAAGGMPHGFYWADLESGESVRPTPNLDVLPSPRYVDLNGPLLSADGRTMIYEGRVGAGGLAVYAFRADTGITERVSGASTPPGVLLTNSVGHLLGASRDGGFVAYVGSLTAGAATVSPGDDVFVRRLATGELRRVVRWWDGSMMVSFSADGLRMALQSRNAGLAPGDGNEASDIFLYDWNTDSLRLVSGAATSAVPAATLHGMTRVVEGALSRDGQRIAVTTFADNWGPPDTNRASDVFVRDLATGATLLASRNAAGTGTGNRASRDGVLSADGRWVAFRSLADDLVAGDGNGAEDVFLCELGTDRTVLASRTPDGRSPAGPGTGRPVMAADGSLVFFEGRTAELVPGVTAAATQIFGYDRQAGRVFVATPSMTRIGGANSDCRNPVLSPDGRELVFESRATNLDIDARRGVRLVYAADTSTGWVRALAPVDSTSLPLLQFPVPEPLATFAPDGSRVWFLQGTESGRAVLEHEFAFNTTRRFGQDARWVSANQDGRLVAFRTLPTGPGSGVRVELFDRATGQTNRIAASETSTFGTVRLTPDGRFLVFTSSADDLVPGDLNGRDDLFLRDLARGTTVLLNAGIEGGPADQGTVTALMSPDGSTVAFLSAAGNLAPGDFNRQTDVFVVRLPGPESDFRVTAVSRAGSGEVTLVWAARDGARYRVQASSDPGRDWGELDLPVAVAGGQATAIDAGTQGIGRRFYRVVELMR